jgi:hypothetical protein
LTVLSKYSVFTFYSSLTHNLTRKSKILNRVERNLAKFDADRFKRIDRGWRLSFEWEALQPQRIRLIKPVLYVYSPESAKLSIKAKVFADSIPEPLVLEANVSIEANQSFTELTELLPDWKKLLVDVPKAKSVVKKIAVRRQRL